MCEVQVTLDDYRCWRQRSVDDKKQHVCPGSLRPGDLRTSLHLYMLGLRSWPVSAEWPLQSQSAPSLQPCHNQTEHAPALGTRQSRVRCRDPGCRTSRRRSTGQPAPRPAWEGQNLNYYMEYGQIVKTSNHAVEVVSVKLVVGLLNLAFISNNLAFLTL